MNPQINDRYGQPNEESAGLISFAFFGDFAVASLEVPQIPIHHKLWGCSVLFAIPELPCSSFTGYTPRTGWKAHFDNKFHSPLGAQCLGSGCLLFFTSIFDPSPFPPGLRCSMQTEMKWNTSCNTSVGETETAAAIQLGVVWSRRWRSAHNRKAAMLHRIL